VVVNPKTGSVGMVSFTPVLPTISTSTRLQHRRPPTNEVDALTRKIEGRGGVPGRASACRPGGGGFMPALGPGDQGRLEQHNVPKNCARRRLVGFTIFEVDAASATPVWVTLTLFGLNHFIEMQSELAGSARAAEG
jgi:hypothetical protein